MPRRSFACVRSSRSSTAESAWQTSAAAAASFPSVPCGSARGKRRRRRYRSERGAYRRGKCGAERLRPDRFTARTGDVVEDEVFLQALAGDGFDIVCANIVADVIIRLAPVVPKLMRPDAAFVCSGILTTREDDVRAALAAAGLEIVHAAHEGEWCGLTARLGER